MTKPDSSDVAIGPGGTTQSKVRTSPMSVIIELISMASSLAQLGLLVAHEIYGWYRESKNHKEEGPKKDPPLMGKPSFFVYKKLYRH